MDRPLWRRLVWRVPLAMQLLGAVLVLFLPWVSVWNKVHVFSQTVFLTHSSLGWFVNAQTGWEALHGDFAGLSRGFSSVPGTPLDHFLANAPDQAWLLVVQTTVLLFAFCSSLLLRPGIRRLAVLGTCCLAAFLLLGLQSLLGFPLEQAAFVANGGPVRWEQAEGDASVWIQMLSHPEKAQVVCEYTRWFGLAMALPFTALVTALIEWGANYKQAAPPRLEEEPCVSG